jgi:hypothetical protein
VTELLQKLIDVIKGLTWVNVGILAALVLISFPAYFAWRTISDPQFAGLVLSEYREIDSPTDCVLSLAQPAGTEGSYFIRAVLAERNREIWYVSVKLHFEPDSPAMIKYCATLTAMVEFARDPYHQDVPRFPDSNRNLVPVATPAR